MIDGKDNTCVCIIEPYACVTKHSAPFDHGYSRTAARTIAMMLILIVAGRIAHEAATVARSTSAHNSVTESLESVTHFVTPVSKPANSSLFLRVFESFFAHCFTLQC